MVPVNPSQPAGSSPDPRPRSPGSRRRRHGAWVAALLGIVALVYVVTLPMRQAPFSVRDHELTLGRGEATIEGSLRNRGAEAPWVRVEAYLYDADNRYLGTVEATYRDVPKGSVSRFRLPIEPSLAGRVERYSLYAGVGPNPYAPDRN